MRDGTYILASFAENLQLTYFEVSDGGSRKRVGSYEVELKRCEGECVFPPLPALECGVDSQCGPTERCNIRGECVSRRFPPCEKNRDCGEGYCNDGRCEKCSKDSQCGAAQHCNLLGDCVNDLGNDAICTNNGECLSDICSWGFCAECLKDAHCDPGLKCDARGDCVKPRLPVSGSNLPRGKRCSTDSQCQSRRCAVLYCR